MPDDLIATLGRLKQTDEVWEGAARLERRWTTFKHGPPYRRSFVLLTDGQGSVLVNKLLDAPPTAEELWLVLAQTMRRPLPGAGQPRRPKSIYFDHAEQVQDLTPRLAAVGVRCELHPHLPALEKALRALEWMQNQGQTPLPGLLSIPGLTPPLLGHLYTTAAEFFELAPWRVLNDNHPIEIRCPLDAPSRYATIMGNGGEVFGLSVNDTLADLRRMVTNNSERDLTNKMSWFVLFYEEATAMAFDDLDAIAHYGWPVPGEDAYPVIGRTQPGTQIGLPTRPDLLWLASALPAICVYFKEHLRQRRGRVRPAELTLTVPVLGSPTEVYLRLPALGSK